MRIASTGIRSGIPSTKPGDRDWNAAGKVMADRGVDLTGRSMMQENIATYLAHRPGDAELPTGRWENKLNRDLARPYTDQEVLRHADHLQNSLLKNLSEMPSYPAEIYLTGSFAKGRLSPHCDLNGYAPLPSEQFPAAFHTFQQRFEGNKDGTEANLFPLSESSQGFNKAMLMVEGSSLKLSTERLKEPGYLRSLYTNVQASRDDKRMESRPGSDGLVGKMWRSKFERETFHFKAMRWALHAGGTLARIPLLGSLLEAAAGLVVEQSHRDLTGK